MHINACAFAAPKVALNKLTLNFCAKERARRKPSPSPRTSVWEPTTRGNLSAQRHRCKRSRMRHSNVGQLASNDVDDPRRGIAVRVNDQVKARPHPDISVLPKTEIQLTLGGMAALDHTATADGAVLQDETSGAAINRGLSNLRAFSTAVESMRIPFPAHL